MVNWQRKIKCLCRFRRIFIHTWHAKTSRYYYEYVSAPFQHSIKIDFICKKEIKKSTQNEIETKDKCKFLQRGCERRTTASVETAACVRLVAKRRSARLRIRQA